MLSLTASNEDYLRAIWKLGEWQDHPATTSELARTLGLSPSTISEGVSKLVGLGLVRHAPYGAISLTDEGMRQAGRMVRIHRLLETGLVELFNYTWDEVHEEAEHLEHAVSDRFIRRLDAALGHPTRDPHGDIIPPEDSTDLDISNTLLPLASLEVNNSAIVERVSDQDSDVLIYLQELGLLPGVHVSVEEAQRGIGLMRVRCGKESVRIALTAARHVLVRLVNE